MHSSADARQVSSIKLENALDASIEALVLMDVGSLLPLASFCHELDTERLCASMSNVTYARLACKLLVFERLLRQTRIHLNVFGLGQERETTVLPYSLTGRH